MKYSNSIHKTEFRKVKDDLLKLKEDFKELKERELSNGEMKTKTEIEEMFFELINESIDDVNKFEHKEMMKKRTFAKIIWYIWYDWFIIYIANPIKKRLVVFKKIRSLFKTDTTKYYIKLKLIKNMHGSGMKPRKLQLVKEVRNLSRLKKKGKQSKTE